ncbi:arginase family protein [uncultured Desulfobulbus sp.]|uniref:arginase family protein n=1 Tax=uncultured Desulfobulbus sp. TaxID=239745 RepID=UPI0029C7E1EE|nr:arginase family protein [uncultured Desulfobulbus sp.]
MNFLNLSATKPPYNQAKAVILPIPYKGSGRTPSMNKGPEVILQASQMLSAYDVETNTDLNELNLHTLDPMVCPDNRQEVMDELANQTSPHFKKNKLVAAIGGSHLISEGLVRAALGQDNNLSVLHLGAHPHLLDPATEEPDVMARIKEKCMISHIGIRSMVKAEKGKILIDNLVFARDIYNNGLNAAADAIDVLSETVYLAINLDVLDPACMPAVAKPEPGGLDWYTLNNLIRMVAREKTIIGFDVTGLAPQQSGLHTHLLAAKLVYKTLICCLHNNR